MCLSENILFDKFAVSIFDLNSLHTLILIRP